MIVLWLFDIALVIMEWFFAFFEELPLLDTPSGLTLVAPVPFMGSSGIAMLNTWLPATVLIASALIVGRVLQWLYELIPFKMS